MTPTREQVIEFCEAAGLPESFSAHPGVKQAIRNAYSAGRLKGLDEAKEACEAERVEQPSHTGEDYAAYDEAITACAAAIDQLKEQK